MKRTLLTLLVSMLGLASCRPIHQPQPYPMTQVLPPAEEVLNIVPWPDGKAPDRFMVGLQIVSLPVAQTREIVENAKPSETPHLKPEFKTPLAAAQYFGTHLNMVEPPKYMALHTDLEGKKYYLFSGGRHWARRPIFSVAAVLLETGEIRTYEEDGHRDRDAPHGAPLPPHRAYGSRTRRVGW